VVCASLPPFSFDDNESSDNDNNFETFQSSCPFNGSTNNGGCIKVGSECCFGVFLDCASTDSAFRDGVSIDTAFLEDSSLCGIWLFPFFFSGSSFRSNDSFDGGNSDESGFGASANDGSADNCGNCNESGASASVDSDGRIYDSVDRSISYKSFDDNADARGTNLSDISNDNGGNCNESGVSVSASASVPVPVPVSVPIPTVDCTISIHLTTMIMGSERLLLSYVEYPDLLPSDHSMMMVQKMTTYQSILMMAILLMVDLQHYVPHHSNHLSTIIIPKLVKVSVDYRN